MQATKTVIEPKTVHAVWRSFIILARGESFDGGDYTDEIMKADVLNNELTLDTWTWRGHKRVIEAVEKFRGRTPDDQFEKGIVSMLSRVEGLFISHKMRQMFGIELLSQMEHFDKKGEFQISRRHDLMAPVKRNGLITGMRFFTIEEIKKPIK